MPGNFGGGWQALFFALPLVLVAAIYAAILRRAIKNHFGRLRAVRARVLDKYFTSYQAVSNLRAAHTVTDYVVVFDAGGKTLKFKTSIWVYDSVRKGETGTLRYRGGRLVDFS